MFCSKCGNELYGDVNECPFCGCPISSGNGQKQQLNAPVSGGPQGQPVAEHVKKNPYRKLFVDPNERLIATIGNGYSTSVISGNGLSSGYGILTDKRCYFKGTCYSSTGSSVTKTKDHWTIDLQDISASGFRYSSNIMQLIICVIFTGLFFISLLLSSNGGDTNTPFSIVTAIAAVIFFLLYTVSKTTLYTIYFAGGGISIDLASFEGAGDFEHFDKQLRIAKNNISRTN